MSISATRPSLGSEQNRDSDIRFPKLRRGNGEHCEDVWFLYNSQFSKN